MFKKSSKGYYFWEEFARVDGIVHGFSTRKFADMNIKNPKSNSSLGNFLKKMGVGNKSVVKMNQVHGNNVSFISSYNHKEIIDKTDGLIASQKDVFLVVTFADCVPALFLDKNKKFFGIAHAGWKGVYKEIVKTMIEKMVKKGSRRSEIMVGLGPSIRVCCYDVYKDRVDAFKDKFPKMKKIAKIKNGKIFLDLIKIVKLQLKNCGILDRNILDCKLCTKDNILDFYSFRKEGNTKSFGLSSGIIGRI